MAMGVGKQYLGEKAGVGLLRGQLKARGHGELAKAVSLHRRARNREAHPPSRLAQRVEAVLSSDMASTAADSLSDDLGDPAQVADAQAMVELGVRLGCAVGVPCDGTTEKAEHKHAGGKEAVAEKTEHEGEAEQAVCTGKPAKNEALWRLRNMQIIREGVAAEVAAAEKATTGDAAGKEVATAVGHEGRNGFEEKPTDELVACLAALAPKDAGPARLEAMRRLLKHRPQVSDGG